MYITLQTDIFRHLWRLMYMFGTYAPTQSRPFTEQ